MGYGRKQCGERNNDGLGVGAVCKASTLHPSTQMKNALGGRPGHVGSSAGGVENQNEGGNILTVRRGGIVSIASIGEK